MTSNAATAATALPAPLERRRLAVHIAQMLVDGAMLLGGMALATFIYLGNPYHDTVWGSAAIILPLFWTVALLNRTYSQSSLVRPYHALRQASSALLTAALLVLLVLFLARSSLELSRFGFLLGCLTGWLGIAWARYNLQPLVRRWLGPRATNTLVILDGGEPVSVPYAFRLDATKAGITPRLDDPAMLSRLARAVAPMDRVIVSCPADKRGAWAALLKGLHIPGEIVAAEVEELGIFGTRREEGTGTLIVAASPLGLRARVAKRLVDLAIVVPALIVLAAPLLIIGMAIRLSDGGPALFRQQRVGRNSRLFEIYKLRTMRVGDDGDRAATTARDDERITRLGRWLRRTSIDELPQLMNVLKGEMSLVGPRPHALASQAGDKLFWEVDARYWQRHALKPGMSGLAQVRGLRGATEAERDLVERLQSDLEYQDGWTLWRDLAIIARTVAVLRHDRAF